MKKQFLYYLSCDMGCTIVAAPSLATAEQRALRRVGTDNFHFVREASQKDVDWVRGMGGFVPTGELVK